MANIIKIKRSVSGTSAPSALARGELAYSEGGEDLYIGSGTETAGAAANIVKVSSGFGIADLDAVRIDDADAADNDYAKFTANGIEGRSYTEVKSDISLNNVENTALSTWAGTTNIVTLGTIATGVWSGTALVAGKLPKLNGITQPDGDMNFNGQTLTNIDEPTADTDAATKGYVDAKAQGLDVKESVRLATAADLPACTYAQPVATTGVGATLTANANGALTVDGVAVAINDRVLVQHQGTGTETHAHNGIYRVSTLGTGSAAWVLTRAVDFDESDEISAAAFVFVEAGTANPDSGFVCTTDGAITFSSSTFSGVGWTQFSGAGQVLAGTGLTKSGNTLNAIGTSNRISVSADAIDIHTSYVGQNTITTLGTVGTGTWNGNAITVAYGGTGASSLTTGTVLLGNGTSAVTQLAKQAAGKILTSEGTAGGDGAVWSNSLSGITIDCGTF